MKLPIHRDPIPEAVLQARFIRAKILQDPSRPAVHFCSPEGTLNDANGLIYHAGRYHMFYLSRTPIPDAEGKLDERWVEVWDHVSSRDLIHWVHHPVALEPATDGSTPLGIWSGDAIEGAPVPTLIYHVPGQGACVAQSVDPDLDTWTPFPENPVIPLAQEGDEYISFDTTGWYSDGVCFLLVGNRSKAPGHEEGDGSSLFTSTDLKNWEYQGPFYQSRREWTPVELDCACPDVFPFGDEHMLLMHGHKPIFHVHYYLGKLKDRHFEPRLHARMSGEGSGLAAPETWLDDQGRRIMIGWIRPPGVFFADWEKTGWSSTMSLPRVLEPDAEHGVRMYPVPELQSLRGSEISLPSTEVKDGERIALPALNGKLLEIEAEFLPGETQQLGLEVLCSGDGQERTVVEVDLVKGVLRGCYAQSSVGETPDYSVLDPEHAGSHELPFILGENETLRLQIFVDRSVVEVFANERQCLVLQVYPSLPDSEQVYVFARGGDVELKSLSAWPLDRVNPW